MSISDRFTLNSFDRFFLEASREKEALPDDIDLEIDKNLEVWLKKGKFLSKSDFLNFQAHLKNLSIETRLSLTNLAKALGIQSEAFKLLLEQNLFYLNQSAESFFKDCHSYQASKEEIDRKLLSHKKELEKSDFNPADFSFKEDNSSWQDLLQSNEIFTTKDKMSDYQITAKLIETIKEPVNYVVAKVCNSHPNVKEVCQKTEELTSAIGTLLLTPFEETFNEAKKNYQNNLEEEAAYHADVLNLDPSDTNTYQKAALFVQSTALGFALGASLAPKIKVLSAEKLAKKNLTVNYPPLKLGVHVPKHMNEFVAKAEIYKFSKTELGSKKTGFLEASLPYVKTNQEIFFVIQRSISHLELLQKTKTPVSFSTKNLTAKEKWDHLMDGLLDFSKQQRFRKVIIAWNPRSKVSLLDYCQEKGLKIVAKGEFSAGIHANPLELIEIHLKN